MHFLPVQLLLVQLKKQLTLLFFWVFLIGLIAGKIGAVHGLDSMFLNPEYLGKVGFMSFFLLGVCFGGFLMTWFTTSYILNGFRVPFLATSNRPFGHYCVNSALIPLLFLFIYSGLMVAHQVESEYSSGWDILIYQLGFLLGTIVWLVLVAVYYQFTNKNIFVILGKRSVKELLREQMKVQSHFQSKWPKNKKALSVHTYLSMDLHLKPVRNIEHYDPEVIKKVFHQNHINAVIGQVLSLLVLIGLGLLVDVPAFQIPAAGSVLILFSLLIGFVGALSFWTRGWRFAFFILVFLFFNYIAGTRWFSYESQAPGLDYSQTSEYSLNSLKASHSIEGIRGDKAETIEILEAWKAQQGEDKPPMVLLCNSGGGYRSMAWVFHVLQALDKESDGALMKRSALITGASGGMIGAAFYRELSYRSRIGENIDPADMKYYYMLCKDLLNPIIFTMIVNDIIYPLSKYSYTDKSYIKDRGYQFDSKLAKNTGGLMDRRLGDYKAIEASGLSPMLILSPVVVGDQRKVFLSPHGTRYFSIPNEDGEYEYDGFDLRALLPDAGVDSLRFLSALRFNATYPYILPSTVLPTSPTIELMDAGARDNFGIENATRFVHHFNEWISANCSRVIVVQIRDSKKDEAIAEGERGSIINRLFKPLAKIYANMSGVQDFEHDRLLDAMAQSITVPSDIIRFEYSPIGKDKKANLSLHLNEAEKQGIRNAWNGFAVQLARKKLIEMIEPKP